MKRLMKVFSLILFLGVILSFSSTQSYAEEIQYSENLIPAMTSNTSPSGEASASSIYSNEHSAFDAFDHSIGTYDAWAPEAGTTTGWIAYEFPESKCITKYTISTRSPLGTDGEQPKDWTFEAWDQQSNSWIVLDKQTNITDWITGEKKEFYISNTNMYSKYRVNISANNGYFLYTALGELEMMETVGQASPQTALKVVEEVGQTIQLSVNNNLSYNTQMTWSSSDSTIASVDNQGRVTGVKPGDAVITVTNADGTYTDSINILVIEVEEQLAVDLNVGDSRRLTVDDLADTANVTWSSDDSNVATVDSKGKVTAVAQGTTYITVKDDQGNEIGKIYVRVRN